MDIVTEKAFKDRLSDGIDTIVNLTEEDFGKLIDMLTIEPYKKIEDYIYFFYSTDNCRHPDNDIKLGLDEKNERRYLHLPGYCYSIPEFISNFESYVQSFEEDSNEYLRYNKIITTRNMDALKKYFSGKNREDSELVDKLFEVVLQLL